MNVPNQGARSALKGGILTEPCDRVVFATNDVVAGEFRCPATYPGFLTAGRINHYIVAFPRTAVWIERERAPRFVADPSFATIYNPGQPYLRHPISPEGDLSDWLGVSECLARDAVRRFNPGDADHPEPLRHVRAPVSHPRALPDRRPAGGDRGDQGAPCPGVDVTPDPACRLIDAEKRLRKSVS